MPRDTAAIGDNVVIGSNTPPVESTLEALIRFYNRFPNLTDLSPGDLLKVDAAGDGLERVPSGTFLVDSGAQWPLSAFWDRAMMGAEPLALTVLGDSTSNDTIDFPFLLADWLATELPAYTVQYHLWNTTDQRYGTANTRSTGTDGARYASISDFTADSVESDDGAELDTTDLDIRIKLAATDWTPTATRDVVARDAADPNRFVWLQITSGGLPQLLWSPDGTAASLITATCDTAITTVVSDGSPIVLRVTLDVDNGASGYDVKFWTAASNTSFTQLGSTITGGATTNLPAVNSKWKLGRSNSTNGLAGDFYWFEQRAGIDSSGVVARWDASLCDDVHTTMVDIAGRTWTMDDASIFTGALALTVLNGSSTGYDVATVDDATRRPKLLALSDCQVVIVNLGHNEGTTTAYRASYKGLTDDIVTAYPDAAVILTVQNPQTDAATNPTQHAVRQRQVSELAGSQRFAVLNAWKAITDYGAAWSTDLMADTVHPDADGQARIESAAEALFTAAKVSRPTV